MNYKKERNFIVANDGFGTVIGKWDILTGEFYGKSGKVVKTVPSCFTYEKLDDHYYGNSPDTILAKVIRMYRDWISHGHIYEQKKAQRLEELISVGLIVDSFYGLDDNIKLTKDLVNYIKEQYNGHYANDRAEAYVVNKKYKDFLKDKPQYIIDIFTRLASKYPADYLKSIITRIINEHVAYMWEGSPEYNCGRLTKLISNYYNYCMDMYGEVKISPNILSNYAQINFLHNEWKNAHYNEVLEKNNNKPFLNFRYGNYFARPLLTREDFHFEGESQHNCVERMYMERVYNNETYIVVVRDINNPNGSLITCEVNHNGKIIQYLATCNRSVYNNDLVNFKNMYQAHLDESVGE